MLIKKRELKENEGMSMKRRGWYLLLSVGIVGAILWSTEQAFSSSSEETTMTLINVSYDATREFYEAYNTDFAAYYKARTGKEIIIHQSHGGSGNQARAVVEGFDADIVTLALAQDVNLLQKVHLLDSNWESSLPNYSAPYTSTVVFLVRQGNALKIRDWDDLVKPNVRIIAPDPKSSGGACWIFLAAYAYGAGLPDDTAKATNFVKRLYENVVVMDAGARGATTTFVENKQGDVLLVWENEAKQILQHYPGEYKLVTPSVSIVAEPSVAVVANIARKRGTYEVAEDYLTHLYAPESQRLIAQYGFRPTDSTVMTEVAKEYPTPQRMVTIRDFGGWAAAYERFFEDGALFDMIRDE
ncbi:sulfate ABC transporter substrate-binding protein [Veillonella intestinalis]|uniref:sulfate ABC transporter substrate-binding protein n=2 Tax=Veillonella intestinalis TaxID=2941341 RepID=UPI00203F1F1D|nr:sulfate ABC transporter substrate-binding protein [Veillonella intestinalis]